MSRLNPQQRDERVRRYEEIRAERTARSIQNKLNWPRNLDNANYRHELQREAVMVESVEAASADIDSLNALRSIMLDSSAPVIRRLSAAEAVLTYELAPGALARNKGEPVASGAYAVLRTIAHTPGVPEATRLRALVSLAQIENARASKADPAAAAAEREIVVQLVNSRHRMTMIAAGYWPPTDDSWRLPAEAAVTLDDETLQQLLDEAD